MTNVSGSLVCPIFRVLGQTSDPETLVMHPKMMPGNNPEDFKQRLKYMLQIIILPKFFFFFFYKTL
jgi:hypothetical protein